MQILSLMFVDDLVLKQCKVLHKRLRCVWTAQNWMHLQKTYILWNYIKWLIEWDRFVDGKVWKFFLIELCHFWNNPLDQNGGQTVLGHRTMGPSPPTNIRSIRGVVFWLKWCLTHSVLKLTTLHFHSVDHFRNCIFLLWKIWTNHV